MNILYLSEFIRDEHFFFRKLYLDEIFPKQIWQIQRNSPVVKKYQTIFFCFLVKNPQLLQN